MVSLQKGPGREHIKYPQDLNLLTGTINMDDATRKRIRSCARASATISTAMRLVCFVTGEKYSDKQTEHIFEQAKGVVCGEDIIHPDKTTASNLLKIPYDIPITVLYPSFTTPNMSSFV
jgi:hypothetical protein